jgi:hypothetical protein
VALDVGYPQLVALRASEAALDPVRRGGHVGDLAELRPAGDTLQASALHQHLDRTVPDPDTATERELGVHPSGAIDAAGRSVDLGDQIGEQRMSHRRGDGGRLRQA